MIQLPEHLRIFLDKLEAEKRKEFEISMELIRKVRFQFDEEIIK